MYLSLLAIDLPPALTENLGWIIAGLIIVVGLFVIGIKDVARFRLRRVWAISGVCFDESIRRRILWITPLAILGVIIVAQLQKPVDEQDAIRQTTKFCLFATGLVVTITTIILACTNLPREIDNRVIYTVVTKPTTRLEIVLGKIVGFARVSAAILLIMGVFTYAYLGVRAWSLRSDITKRLQSNDVDVMSKPTLEHYRDFGLLNAKSLATPTSMSIYARLPEANNPRRYFNNEGMVLVPFQLPANNRLAADPEGKTTGGVGLVMHVRVGYDAGTAPKPATPKTNETPTTQAFSGPSPLIASSQPAGAAATPAGGPPQLIVQIFDANQNSLLTSDVNGGKPVTLGAADGTEITIPIAAGPASQLLKQPIFFVTLIAGSNDVSYWIDDHPAELQVPVTDSGELQTVQPSQPRDANHPKFVFLGRQGTNGQQIKGAPDPDRASACVYQFNNASVSGSGDVPIELRVGIERGGDDPTSAEAPTRVAVQVRNKHTGEITNAPELRPENNRTAYTSVPAAAFAGGDFDVILRCLTPEHWVSLNTVSLGVVRGEAPFALNLAKSLFIIWLLAVLVIAISIFSSTFLSWPIAVVLTLVILLGRWGVQELGDAATAGLGRQFVQDFGVRDPASAQALSSTVEQLNKMLGVVATVLPDISRFSATEDIERGISIPTERVTDALGVLFGFGIPLSVLAYVFLKNKEVAP
jgi:hypothetical protein